MYLTVRDLTHRIQQPIPKLFDEKKVCKSRLFLYYCGFFLITNLIGQNFYFFLELVIGSGARYLLVEKQDLVISV